MTEKQMVLGLHAGNERALDAVIETYSRLLWSIVRAVLYHVGSAEDMEECVADAFIQLWRNRETISESRGGMKSWLCVAAKSRAIDCYRKRVRKNEVSLDEQLCACGAGLFDQTLDTVLQRELLAVINALGEPDREILLRRYYYRQTPRDIAVALDMTVKQVENRLFRTKRQLRSRLKGETPCQV